MKKPNAVVKFFKDLVSEVKRSSGPEKAGSEQHSSCFGSMLFKRSRAFRSRFYLWIALKADNRLINEQSAYFAG